ncbi:uncharacterized protein [Nicotiana sylvestris]|uniref:uncharacterized protein n=1 Tax=Nicotiana sylvestris TaxID=4096 RepID=UPI00388CE2AA
MHPLKYIFQKPMPTGKLAKWQTLLSEFDIVYVSQKAVKGQALADHLAENSVGEEYGLLKMFFPDEEVSFVGECITEAYDGWRMFFDGVANFKGVGIGAVLVSEIGQHYPISAKLRFPCTNNMAEYEACIMGLNLAIDMNIQELLELMKRFTKVEFKHVPKIQNEFADVLATLSSMIQHPDKNFIDPIAVKIHNQPAYCAHGEEETDVKPWFRDMKEYLARGEYPEQANHTQKRTLRRLSNHFFQSGGTLYRRTPDLVLLRCVDAKEASRLLEEIHAGTCGPHMNGFVLAKKILKVGYFWMTMETDFIRYIQKCHRCQVHADMVKVPPNELNATSAPWPFAAWGMDVIGPIEPTVSNGYRFILVAIDYFTKWVEAASYKAVTKKVVANFVKDCIVCQFGVPNSIITDNSTNLNSDLMKAICETFKIKHKNSTAYRPQMNGAMEATNKNIKKILRKMVENHKQWHEKLPFALLGYRITARTSTRATPYLLVYGTEAIIPAELYQNRMSRAFNKSVRPRQFALGQLVLKKIFPHQDEAKGKFSP